MLRGALGAPYEFLWANPYQPGLSFEHVPLVFHDEQVRNADSYDRIGTRTRSGSGCIKAKRNCFVTEKSLC